MEVVVAEHVFCLSVYFLIYSFIQRHLVCLFATIEVCFEFLFRNIGTFSTVACNIFCLSCVCPSLGAQHPSWCAIKVITCVPLVNETEVSS